jgi:hypothetical protein
MVVAGKVLQFQFPPIFAAGEHSSEIRLISKCLEFFFVKTFSHHYYKASIIRYDKAKKAKKFDGIALLTSFLGICYFFSKLCKLFWVLMMIYDYVLT